jgi:hypothetical protein
VPPGKSNIIVTCLVITAVGVAFGAYGFAKPPRIETSVSYRTATIYGTKTVLVNTALVGTCGAVSYFVPDTLEEVSANVTVTSGTSTMVYENVSVSEAGTTTVGTYNYSTSSYGNLTGYSTTTSTSDNLNERPSDGWSVIVCTYHP